MVEYTDIYAKTPRCFSENPLAFSKKPGRFLKFYALYLFLRPAFCKNSRNDKTTVGGNI